MVILRHTNSLIFKDLGIASVWIFSSKLPHVKERLPVNVGEKSRYVIIFKCFRSNYSGLRYCSYEVPK